MADGKRKGAGRPPGTPTGKKERISITVSKDHKAWLESKELSYAKTIAGLIDKEVGNETN